MIYIHKFLPLIVSPLGLVCLLLLISLWWRQIKWIVLALVFLLIFSLPLTSFLIWKSLEAEHPYKPVEALKKHQVEKTADEAQAVLELTKSHGISSVILVTSSFHLPRAHLLFNQAGVVNEAYPADFKFLYRPYDWLSFLPNAEAFFWTSSGIREYIGRLYYWIRT